MTDQAPPSREEILGGLPDDWWQRATIAEFLLTWFRQFIVGLLVAGSAASKFQYYVYTGFLLRDERRCIWLTAGHVVDQLKEVLASPTFTVSLVRWLDGYEVPGAEGIPVNPAGIKMRSWRGEGLDVGAIELTQLEARALKANNKVSMLDQRTWKKLGEAAPEGYYVVGFPNAWSDLREQPVSGNQVLRSLRADLACLPARPAARPIVAGEDPFRAKPTAFYGQIVPFPDAPRLRVEDISGMSGGPILSIERSADFFLGIRLVGVQSVWLASSQIVRAEPIDEIIGALQSWAAD